MSFEHFAVIKIDDSIILWRYIKKMSEILGIIAAHGALPIIVASHSKKAVVACLTGITKKSDFSEHIAEEFQIGKVSSILNFFKKHNVKNIVICGHIKRPNLSDIAVDTKGALLLSKILASKLLGDDKLLRIVAEYIEKEGFSIKSPMDYIHQKKIVTKIKPSKRNLHDIEIGMNASKTLGSLDIGQSVIIENGVVIAVEAAEGTDELIKRSKNLAKKTKSAIVVKSMKPNQDPRLDTPVIGVNTIVMLYENNFAGIAIENSGVIVINPEDVLKKANELGIFIWQY
ncbi:MAG: hypothetical protein RLZZ59_229 [Pseudomonadota bacterium]